MEIKATASQLCLRERRQRQSEVKIAESPWKCVFAVLIGERGTETPARIEALPMTSHSAGSPSGTQQAPVLELVPQIKGLNSPTPAVLHGQFIVGPTPFFSSKSSFTLGNPIPF